MSKLKNYSVCFYGTAALLCFVCIFLCFGQGLSVSGSIAGISYSGSADIYEMTFGDGMVGGLLAA